MTDMEARGALTVPMQKHVFAAMLRDAQTFARCRAFVKAEHFSDEATSDVVAYALNAWDKFKEVPGRSALMDVFKTQETHQKVIKRCFDESQDVNDVELTIDRIARFARTRALRLAVRECAAVLKYEDSGDDSELPRDAKGRPLIRDIDDIMAEAAMVGSDAGDIGVFINDAVKNAIDRAKAPNDRELFDTGFPHLDECGVNIERGEVGCVLARAKGGKSHVLLNLAVANARKGHKVVIYNFEIREDRLEDRLAARLARAAPSKPGSKAAQDELPPLPKGATEEEKEARILLMNQRDEELQRDHMETQQHLESWIATLKKRVGLYDNNLLLKKFIAKKHTMDDVRAHLIRCRAEGFIPDMVILDYIGIVKSTEKFSELRHTLGNLWLDFRSLCQEFKVAGWSAAQANRGGAAAELVTMTAIAESFEIVQHIDVGFSVNRKDDEMQNNEGRFFVFASRNDRDNMLVNFKCDFSSSTIQTVSIGRVSEEGDDKDKKRKPKKSEDDIANAAARSAIQGHKRNSHADARP